MRKLLIDHDEHPNNVVLRYKCCDGGCGCAIDKAGG